MATKTAPAKPYDPVKALEGMFNGSVTRIAHALRDPVNYSASTKTILTKAAKRFHDALDDCEVQLLDAKWYLEHQLEQNRLRREAKARELGTAAKRKHEEIQEAQPEANEETPTKKPKIEEDRQKQPEAESVASKTKPADAAAADTKTRLPAKTDAPTEAQDQDDFAKPTPQVSPVATTEDFNFESMFGDTNANDVDNDLGFDLGLDSGFNEDNDTNALESVIPEIDGFPTTNANPAPDATTTAVGDALPAFSNDFDLPEIGSTNAFDDFFDDGLGGDLGGANVDLNDQALLDMEFDDSLFN